MNAMNLLFHHLSADLDADPGILVEIIKENNLVADLKATLNDEMTYEDFLAKVCEVC